jgi:hypothetical protein
MRIKRNQLCPCGSEKKYKKCCGSVQRVQPEAAPVVASDNIISVYQPLAAHGYDPAQLDGMLRFAAQMRPAR